MTGMGDEFSLVPQWLKSSHGLQSPGAGSHSAGQQRDPWHHGRSSTSITPNTRTATEPALRPASLSAGAAAPNSTSMHTNGGNSGSSGGGSSSSLSRGIDRDRDRPDRSERPDRDRAVHGPWSHFHTSSRSGRTGPHGGRESASGHVGGSVDTDRFHTLGSPFKHSSSSGSNSSSRHGLQRSVSDSGSTVAGAADAVHSGFGALHQQRDSRHHLAPSHSSSRQGQREGLGGAGSSAQYGGYNSGDDKMGWRDSNPRQQVGQHGPAGGAGSSRGTNKPPPLTAMDFPSLTGANSMAGSSPRSSSSNDRLGSPQPYAPSVAPYKQDFLASRGSLGWTSKLADVPGTPATSAAAAGGGGLSSGNAGGGAAAAATGGRVAAAAAEPAGEAGDFGSSSSFARELWQSVGSSSRHNSAEGAGADSDAAGDSKTGDIRTAAVPGGVSGSVGAGSTAQSALTGGVLGSTPSGGVSLADTLKQAVAASNAASSGSSAAAAAARLEAQRRQSKALVPLLPGSKAKHGAGNGSSSKLEGRGGAARRLTPALATAAAAATVGSNGSSSAAAKLLSPTSPGPLLTLGLHSHSGATAAAAGGANGSNGSGSSSTRTDPSEAPHAGAAGTAAGGGGTAGGSVGGNGMLSPVSPGGGGVAVAASQAGGSESSSLQKAATGVTALLSPHSSSSHQQHLADRHSFFAVLKRKSSTTHHAGSNSSSKTAGSEERMGDGGVAEQGGSSAPAPAAGGGAADDAVVQQRGNRNSSSSNSPEAEAATVDLASGSGTDQQQQHRSGAGPSSYSLADIPDTISSSSGSEGGCDLSSVCSSSGGHAMTQQQQQGADLAAEGGGVARALAPAGPAAAEGCNVGHAAGGAGRADKHVAKTQQQQQQQQQPPGAPVNVSVSACATNPTSDDQMSSREACGGDSGVSGGWDVLDKEEEAFLRSLGWTGSEDGEGDEGSWGLTQEEISAFQAEAAARSTQQGCGTVGSAGTAAGKLAFVPGVGSLLSGFGGLLEGFARVRIGQEAGGVWTQHHSLSLPNGSGAQGAGVWGLHPYWPPAVVAARIFGGDSSSDGEESDSESDGEN